MPMYRFKCPACGLGRRVLRDVERAGEAVPCSCGTEMTRAAAGASSKVTEVLDNGVMSRRVERLADADEIFRERSRLKPDRG